VKRFGFDAELAFEECISQPSTASVQRPLSARRTFNVLILLESLATHHVGIGCHQFEHVCRQFAKRTCGLVGPRGIVLLSEHRQRSVKLASGKSSGRRLLTLSTSLGLATLRSIVLELHLFTRTSIRSNRGQPRQGFTLSSAFAALPHALAGAVTSTLA